MAGNSVYKQYSRIQRRAVLDSDLSKGMMSSSGVVEDGYLKYLVNCSYEKETSSITPRPGLRLTSTVFPAETFDDADFISDNVAIKDSKQCIENGVTYNQIILGKLDDEDPTKGLIWVLTGSAFLDQMPFNVSEEYITAISFANYVMPDEPHVCKFYTATSPSIHDIYLSQDEYKRIEFPVGCFAYGNSYYFFGEDGQGNSGLFRTVFDSSLTTPMYVFEAVTPKEISVSEAVSYGYNMLKGSDAYSFINQHTAPLMEFEGILPYDPSSGDLIMSPKRNQPIDFVCYYNAPLKQYRIIWEWREINASDWTEIEEFDFTVSALDPDLRCANFKAPASNIMVRVSAYPYENGVLSDTVEKAMVVGFDFTLENYGAARTLDQKVYDLTTASGVESWNGRIVLWGLPSDPTILFISDYNEPAYVPYPNNIVVFDEPIIYAVEFMDSLVVFTTDKIYQVTSPDGNTWNSTVLQSHLSINAWDKHLIQVVRNMLYFKSGNYYYMMVPKAQSLTGELILAPITTPITSFFDNFSVSVQEVIKSTYDFLGEYELLTYYNFLDYEDVHNIYAYKFEPSQAILHFDVIYNTVDRTWRIWIYESPSLIYPFKQEATRTGLFASTSLVRFQDISEDYAESVSRIIQIFNWDKSLVKSCYIPNYSELLFNPGGSTAEVDLLTYCLHLNENIGEVNGHRLIIYSPLFARVEGHRLILQNSDDFYCGYSKSNIMEIVQVVYGVQDDFYTFRNYQFIDSGYRNDELHLKKRYREIQLQLNNLDKDYMQFGMDYILDGPPRQIFYKYEVTQEIDEMNPDYGVVYIESTPYLEAEVDDIDLTNQWCLDQHLMPEVSLWKIRVAVSGKGYAPRIRLYSRNEKRFELLSINWISKLMHMR